MPKLRWLTRQVCVGSHWEDFYHEDGTKDGTDVNEYEDERVLQYWDDSIPGWQDVEEVRE